MLEHEESNADQWAANPATRRIALADGASQSHAPREWAALMTREIVDNGLDLSIDRLARLAENLTSDADPDEPWYVTESRERGSHSTVVAIEVEPVDATGTTTLHLMAVGDSCAFLVHMNQIKKWWPIGSSEDFTAHPDTLSSLDPTTVARVQSTTWSAHPDSVVILATDAMAKYLILQANRAPDASLSDLLPFCSLESGDAAFSQWADQARETGLVDNDDLTVVLIPLKDP